MTGTIEARWAPRGVRGAEAAGRLSLGDFHTASGATIRGAALAWRCLGDLEAAREHGWVVVFHALTGNADVTDWWGPLVGPGRPIDTDRHAVLSANLLGSCYGSSGPSTDPGFPAITPRDQARAFLPLLEAFGVERLALATGGSLGGMAALHFGTLAPVPVDRLVVFAAPAATGAQAIAWNAAQRLAIEADPVRGLAAARAIAMITYRSAAEFDARFGRERTRRADRFDVEHWLRRHGEKLIDRFDAASYLALMGAMDAHDVGPLEAAAAATRARCAEVIGVGIDTDILYPATAVRRWVDAYAAAGVAARYEEIVSPFGHDAFLIEFDQVARLLARS